MQDQCLLEEREDEMKTTVVMMTCGPKHYVRHSQSGRGRHVSDLPKRAGKGRGDYNAAKVVLQGKPRVLRARMRCFEPTLGRSGKNSLRRKYLNKNFYSR